MWLSWNIYFFLKFIQTISPFLIGSKPPANHLHNQPQLTKFGRCKPTNITSIRLYWLEMRLLGQHTIHTIHQLRFPGRPPLLFVQEGTRKNSVQGYPKTKWLTEFLAKTERTNCENAENILLDRRVSSTEENMFNPETVPKNSGEVSLLKLKKYFEWMITQLLNSALYDVKNYADLGGCYAPRPFFLLNLHNVHKSYQASFSKC